MTDENIEDFLIRHIEPIIKTTSQKQPEQNPAKSPENSSKQQYENNLKLLEFYSNNLDKLNKKFEKEFKNFKPIPPECAQCQHYFTGQACNEARKNHNCPKYK